MTTAELVANLKAKGVSLVVKDGKLKCQGKDSALTPELLDTLRERKAEIVALLGGGKRPCQFVTDAHSPTELYWRCTVHQARISNPLAPCFFSRYDGTPLESSPPRPPNVTPPFRLEVKP
jgi:hypothetical protein